MAIFLTFHGPCCLVFVSVLVRDVFFCIETVTIKEFFSTGSIVRMEVNEGREKQNGD